MDTPTYPVTITIGGPNQNTESRIGTVLPRTIVTRQSGSLVITAQNESGAAFSLADLDGTEVKAKPYNSSDVPVTLGTGVVSGTNNEIFTVTWVRDTIPAGWSSFAQDRDGAIVIYVEMEETGVEDYFQWSTRVNVDDGDYVLDAATLPLVNLVFYYNPIYFYDNITTAADPGDSFFRMDNTVLANVTEIYISATNESGVDISSLLSGLSGVSMYISNPNIKSEAAIFTVTNSVDNTGWFTLTVTSESAATLAYTNGQIFSVNFVSSGIPDGSITDSKLADMPDGTIKGRELGAGSGSPSSLDASQVRTLIDFDNEVAANSAVAANTAKVTNATHTGDAAGDTALTLQNAAINGKASGTIEGLQEFLIYDPTLVGLRKLNIVDLIGGIRSSTKNASYQAVLTDYQNGITNLMNVGAANNFTLPLDVTEAIPVDGALDVIQIGAGQTTINGEVGVTINGTLNGSVVINNQYQGATCIKIASDSWIILGDIT